MFDYVATTHHYRQFFDGPARTPAADRAKLIFKAEVAVLEHQSSSESYRVRSMHCADVLNRISHSLTGERRSNQVGVGDEISASRDVHF